MQRSPLLLYHDGSFNGLLSGIFQAFELGVQHKAQLYRAEKGAYNPSLWRDDYLVVTDPAQANRVWNGLQLKLDKKALETLWSVYLSDLPEADTKLLHAAADIFRDGSAVFSDYRREHMLYLQMTERKVHREKHRFEAFVRFSKGEDGAYHAIIDPDHNVLPLIAKHFKLRYADQKWLIYDENRNYGIYYNLKDVTEVSLVEDFSQNDSAVSTPLHPDEVFYRKLWKHYFKSTSIPERKNRKLHLQHIPFRYWKYMTEKAG